MEINGKTLILEPGEELTIKVRASQPMPEPEVPEQPEDPSGAIGFPNLIEEFNLVLERYGFNAVFEGTETWSYLKEMYDAALDEWNTNAHDFLSGKTYPEVYDYHGDNDSYEKNSLTLNAMTSWLMAMCLTEIVPLYSESYNSQTALFRKAFDLGGGITVALYDEYTVKGDPMIVRLAAGCVYATIRGTKTFSYIDLLREELGGVPINGSSWEDLGYANTMLTDDLGRRGYMMQNLGYLVNTQVFLPNAPGPRIEGTTVCELPEPWEDGQPSWQYHPATGNYLADEAINRHMVDHWNMMAQTPLSEWVSYSDEKKDRLINAAATVTCTYNYMFGAPKPVSLVLEDNRLPVVDGYPRYVFEEDADSNLVIDGPFSDLAGIYRYNADGNETTEEMFLKTVLDIADNCRFPTQDPNYGRCRPGCKPTREGGELGSTHGAAENEIYNISIASMVADNNAQKEKIAGEDGWAADSPRSYVSGHSAQIITMALMLGQMSPDKMQYYMRRAYEYSVNRSIARFHWNSDCILGRLYGTMILPILNAMNGLHNGYEATKRAVVNGVQGDVRFNLTIENTTPNDVTLDGDIVFVLANPDKKGNYYGWEGAYNRTGHIRFCSSAVTIPAGGSKVFSVDATNPELVLRGRNCLDPDLLSVAGRPRNVLLYVDGNSEIVLADNMDPDIVFEDGGNYKLTV